MHVQYGYWLSSNVIRLCYPVYVVAPTLCTRMYVSTVQCTICIINKNTKSQWLVFFALVFLEGSRYGLSQWTSLAGLLKK